MLIVEVGFKLDKPLIYYHDLLTKNGLWLDFSCITHDIYYAKKDIAGLTENEMKNSCYRLRSCFVVNDNSRNTAFLAGDEINLIQTGYKKVFDTIKFDFHYVKDGMVSRVQLQDIKDIGLLVYYDNPAYYELPLDEQREKLINELNRYGFDFAKDELGLDKLRTLYYGKEMFSKNQNR